MNYQPHPLRFQLRRTKGFRKPEDGMSVARPTLFGNPFRVGERLTDEMQPWVHEASRRLSIPMNCPINSRDAVELYRAYMEANRETDLGKYILKTARGKRLGCWCPLNRPCHADVLAELANR